MNDFQTMALNAARRTIQGTWWRFVATGLLINGALFVLLWLLVRVGVDYKLAATICFVTGVLWSYTQNRLWSWKSDAPLVYSTLRFFMTYGAIYLVHMTLIVTMVSGFGLGPVLAAMISVGVLVVPNFLLLNAFVFRRKSPR